MSIFSYAGREKLANWLLSCLYIDLIICGIFLILNFSSAYDYFRVHPLEVAILIFVFCIYVAIIDTIRQKILEYRDGSWKYIAEIVASLYLYLHCIFYILILGSFLSGMYLGSTGTQISSDFLMSWAIILGTLILGVFYLRNKEHHRLSQPEPEKTYTVSPRDFSDKHPSSKDYHPDETGGDVPIRPDFGEVTFDGAELPVDFSSYSVDMSCFICGKRDMMPMKGRDGWYYCRDHILPENRIITTDSGRPVNKSLPKSDTRCQNPRCRREIYHKDIIKCGPCEKLFCKYCWESHRWSHGKAPAIGISYTADGTFSGFDGTELVKK